jgi:hypothetical protein
MVTLARRAWHHDYRRQRVCVPEFESGKRQNQDSNSEPLIYFVGDLAAKVISASSNRAKRPLGELTPCAR